MQTRKKVCYLVPVLFFPCTNSEQHLINLIRIGDVDKGTNPIPSQVKEEKSYQIHLFSKLWQKLLNGKIQ